MKHSRNYLLILTTLFLLPLTIYSAQTLSDYQSTFNAKSLTIEVEHQKNISAINKKYSQSLDAQILAAKKQGNLALYKKIKAEQARFSKDKTIPEGAFAKHIKRAEFSKSKKMGGLSEQYIQALRKLAASLMMEDKIDEAEKVDAEMKKAGFIVADSRASLPSPQKPKPKKPKPSIRKEYEATLYITCDNNYTAWINKKEVGSNSEWGSLEEYDIKIASGDVLAIRASDNETGAKSAGLYCCIVINSQNKSWGSNSRWTCTTKLPNSNWLSKDGSIGSKTMSHDNIAGAHVNRHISYKKRNKSLTGKFVWSKDAAKTIYVREVIDLNKFSQIHQ